MQARALNAARHVHRQPGTLTCTRHTPSLKLNSDAWTCTALENRRQGSRKFHRLCTAIRSR